MQEYRYRKLFGLTHEQYLDEPGDTITWLLAIDYEQRRHDAEREAEANGG